MPTKILKKQWILPTLLFVQSRKLKKQNHLELQLLTKCTYTM